jgi:miniconductance mechanosensitive channel
MTIQDIQSWLDLSPTWPPWIVAGTVLVSSLVVFLITRVFIARGLVYLAERTESQYDDIVVEQLRPFRLAWIAPLLVIYSSSGLLPDAAEFIRKTVLLLALWLIVITINSLLNAVNSIYEASRSYRGQPIQGYLDLAKIIVGVVGIILSITILTGESPVVLLSGMGALMALLLVLFRDTLLSFVASVQIQSNDLVKEGDWIEMPSYGADGTVIDMALHTVRVQNWDNTFTVVPTYKLLDTPFKNWRGMQESGGRRIKRAVHIDLNSIRFCDQAMIDRFTGIDLVKSYLETELAEMAPEGDADQPDQSNRQQITNMSVFRAYVISYLKNRPDIHGESMTFLVRQLAPGPTGMPLEIYVFTKTVDWIEYEAIQDEIINHLVAAAPQFDLRIFQEPTGGDFLSLARSEPTAF